MRAAVCACIRCICMRQIAPVIYSYYVNMHNLANTPSLYEDPIHLHIHTVRTSYGVSEHNTKNSTIIGAEQYWWLANFEFMHITDDKIETNQNVHTRSTQEQS